MPENDSQKKDENQKSNQKFLIGLARAFGGAILFSFAILMTMEMWQLGFYIDRFRLALFIIAFMPVLFGLAYFDGFEDTNSLTEDAADTFVAYTVGFVASALVLFAFNIINFQMSFGEILGKVSIQAITAAVGALVAQSQLGSKNSDSESEDENEDKNSPRSYFGEILLMIIGVIFLTMSIAPTEEMILIAFRMTYWHAFALAIGTLIMMYAVVYAVKFRGQEKTPEGVSFVSIFVRYTVVGYAVVLLVCLYLLWTFGRTNGMSVDEIVKAAIVLGFPGALGASGSRLIL